MISKTFTRAMVSAAALAAALMAAGCGSGSPRTSKPAGPPPSSPVSPTAGSTATLTTAQLKARLLSLSKPVDGYTASIGPDLSGLPAPKPGPPFSREPCSYLARVIVDPATQTWTGNEDIWAYRAGQAQEVTAGLTQVLGRCAGSVQSAATAGVTLKTTEHLVTLTGMGNQALDVQVHVTSQGESGADDWIVIRAGNVLITVSEPPTYISQGAACMAAAARLAWDAYQKAA